MIVTILRRITIVASCLGFALLASLQAASAQTRSGAEVYLMRGFLNVFSLGMDELAEKIKKHGIRAEVYGHASSGSIVSEILAKYRSGDRGPFILIGHSLGASAAVDAANELSNAGVAVDLVIPVDSITVSTATGRTKRIVNYYMSNGMGVPVQAGPGFRGRIQNVDVRDQGISHISIDKAAKVQQLILNQVIATARLRPAAAPPQSAGSAGDQSAASKTTSPAPSVR